MEKPIRRVTERGREARKNGYPSLEPSIFPPDIPKSYSAFERIRSWDQKEDRYTVFADIIERGISRAEASRKVRQPFGLVRKTESGSLTVIKKIPKKDPFDFLATTMQDTLVTAIAAELAVLKMMANSTPLSHEADSYNALQSWVDFQTKHLVYIDPALEIGGGVATAVRSMAGTLEMLPALHPQKNKATTDELLKVAQNSYPMLLDLAVNYEVGETSTVMHALGKEQRDPTKWNFFDPNQFEVSGEGEKMRVTPKQEVINTARQKALERKKLTPTVGCPAAVNFGMGSAIRRLWMWHIDIVRTNPKAFYPNAS